MRPISSVRSPTSVATLSLPAASAVIVRSMPPSGRAMLRLNSQAISPASSATAPATEPSCQSAARKVASMSSTKRPVG